jgi:hypothetical protein
MFVYQALLYEGELPGFLWPLLMFAYGVQVCYAYVFKKTIFAAYILLAAEDSELTGSIVVAIGCVAMVLSVIRV